MLRQLLSTNGDDIGINKPIGIDYHVENQEYKTIETIPDNNNSYYYTQQVDYNNYHQQHEQIPQQQTVIQGPYIQYQNGNNYTEITPTSTSDLYSSTYAMLSNDGIQPPLSQNEWNTYQIADKQQDMYSTQTMYQTNQNLQYTQLQVPVQHQYIPEQHQQPIHVQQQIPQQIVQYNQYYPVNYSEQIQASTSSDSRPSTAELKTRRSSITARSAQQAYSESFRKIAKIPGNPTEEDEERVMCLACKGVYSSRRSLTGHIGRNEKCREVIGRTYISTLAQTGQSEILPDPGSVEGGISPVCPNCDRFISHYKGNIRRHINQCVKRPVRDHKTNNHLSSSIKSMAQHYASIAPIVTKDNPAYHQLSMNEHDEYNNEKKMKSSTSNIAVQSSNPYNCAWCKFSTVYKGNMKRHLISVHNCTDELLRNISFDLERLRALSANRPVTPLCPQPEKIRGCSGRRRKNRQRDMIINDEDDSKKIKLLNDNEEPPAAVTDVIASFALPNNNINNNININNNNCIKFIEEPVAASHDSGISSGSSIDEL